MRLSSLAARVSRMDRREVTWRVRTASRIALDRTLFAMRPPRWDRRTLASVLRRQPELDDARRAASAGDWQEAEHALAIHFTTRPQRFPIAPSSKREVAAAIRRQFSGSPADAAARADHIVAGEYDLLGYRSLRFDGSDPPGRSGPPEWSYDPVHRRRAPTDFWSAVPYLEPSCGDHKIIWELNRHQHFLALGRAFWLTGDPKYRERFIAELRDWFDANPPLAGINWASMLELALRSLSWVWALHLFADRTAADEVPWIVDLLLGLDRQLTQVERNLSRYFSPNTHLLGEALALYVGGRVLPELAGSGRWESVGRAVLVDEIARQIADDGGHCERSTHYHRYTLDFYLLALTVARITGDAAAPEFERAVARLAVAARLLADDNGRAPHIGDDDGGMLAPFCGRSADDWRDSLTTAGALLGRPDLGFGPRPEETLWWLAANTAQAARTAESGGDEPATPPPSAALADTGYYVSRSPRGDHLVIDGGPHGYMNAGHAHADALALTYTVRGVPLLIDCGTGSYTADPELRDRLRSSALHNALVVDGRAQSIPSGPFHWSHIATGSVRRWRTNDRFDYFEGRHDGYRPIEHRRHLLAMHGDLVVVADLVDGEGTHAAAAHWHVDPRWTVAAHASGAVFTHRDHRVELAVPHGVLESFSGDAATGLGWHAPVYGRVEPATTIRVTHRGSAPFWVVSIFGTNTANPIASAETLPVWAEAGALCHSIGVRIVRQRSVDYVAIAEPAGVENGGPPRTWRLGEFETDAQLLFCRIVDGQQTTRVAMIDGSFVRSAARRGFELRLPRLVSDLVVYLDDEMPACLGLSHST